MIPLCFAAPTAGGFCDVPASQRLFTGLSVRSQFLTLPRISPTPPLVGLSAKCSGHGRADPASRVHENARRQPLRVLLPTLCAITLSSGVRSGSSFCKPARAAEIAVERTVAAQDALLREAGTAEVAQLGTATVDAEHPDEAVEAPFVVPALGGSLADAGRGLWRTAVDHWRGTLALLACWALLGLPGALLAAGGGLLGGTAGLGLIAAGGVVGMLRLVPRVRRASFQLESFLQSDFLKVFDFWQLLASALQSGGGGSGAPGGAPMVRMTSEREAALPKTDPVWRQTTEELWAARAQIGALEAPSRPRARSRLRRAPCFALAPAAERVLHPSSLPAARPAAA
jgi:hypothetical protein